MANLPRCYDLGMEAEMAGVFCTRCGHRMSSEEARFCSRCGGAFPKRDALGGDDGPAPDAVQAPAVPRPAPMATTYLLPPLFLREADAQEAVGTVEVPGPDLDQGTGAEDQASALEELARARSIATAVSCAPAADPGTPPAEMALVADGSLRDTDLLPLASEPHGVPPTDDDRPAAPPDAEAALVPFAGRADPQAVDDGDPRLFDLAGADPPVAEALLSATANPSAGEIEALPVPARVDGSAADFDSLPLQSSVDPQGGQVGTRPPSIAMDAPASEVEAPPPSAPPPAAETELLDITEAESPSAMGRQGPDALATGLSGSGIIPAPEDAALHARLTMPPEANAMRPRRNGPWPAQMPFPELGIEADGCRIVQIGEGAGWLEIALAVDARLVCAASALIWLDPALGVEVVASRAKDADHDLTLTGPGSLCLGACPGGTLAVLPLQVGSALGVAHGVRMSARGAGLVVERHAPRGDAAAMRFRVVRPALAILEVSGMPYALTLPPAATLIVGDRILVAADAGVLITPIRQPLPAQRVFGPGSLLLRGGHPE